MRTLLSLLLVCLCCVSATASTLRVVNVGAASVFIQQVRNYANGNNFGVVDANFTLPVGGIRDIVDGLNPTTSGWITINWDGAIQVNNQQYSPPTGTFFIVYIYPYGTNQYWNAGCSCFIYPPAKGMGPGFRTPPTPFFLNTTREMNPPPPSSLVTNLLAYYRLDEASSPWLDSSPYHLSMTGTATSVTGIITNGLSFNGTTEKARATNGYSTSISNLTISSWFKQANGGSDICEFGNRATGPEGGRGFRVIVLGTAAVFQFQFSGDLADVNCNGTSPNNGQWNHFVGTYDGTTMKLYTNAVLAGTFNYTTNTVSITNSFMIGADDSGLRNGIGTDECGLWSRVLTTNEINTLYNSGAGKSYPFQ